MHFWNLRSEQVETLVAQPETGMGFQVVEAKPFYTREPTAWLVFNAEIALSFERGELQRWLESRTGFSPEALRSLAEDIGDIPRELTVTASRAGVELTASPYGATQSIAPNPLSLVKKGFAQANAGYCRFSPFPNDRRVDPITGAFKPGTYATTLTDAPMAPSGFAAVGRYALPNVAPASFVHTLLCANGVIVHSGTVAPAYGQAGGGVEVFFPQGASHKLPRVPMKQLPDE